MEDSRKPKILVLFSTAGLKGMSVCGVFTLSEPIRARDKGSECLSQSGSET